MIPIPIPVFPTLIEGHAPAGGTVGVYVEGQFCGETTARDDGRFDIVVTCGSGFTVLTLDGQYATWTMIRPSGGFANDVEVPPLPVAPQQSSAGVVVPLAAHPGPQYLIRAGTKPLPPPPATIIVPLPPAPGGPSPVTPGGQVGLPA